MQWTRTSPWSIRAVAEDDADGAAPAGPLPYAVSRATVRDTATGVLVPRYSAWHGVPLEPGRRDIPMPTLLGVFGDSAAAKACCEAHRHG